MMEGLISRDEKKAGHRVHFALGPITTPPETKTVSNFCNVATAPPHNLMKRQRGDQVQARGNPLSDALRYKPRPKRVFSLEHKNASQEASSSDQLSNSAVAPKPGGSELTGFNKYFLAIRGATSQTDASLPDESSPSEGLSGNHSCVAGKEDGDDEDEDDDNVPLPVLSRAKSTEEPYVHLSVLSGPIQDIRQIMAKWRSKEGEYICAKPLDALLALLTQYMKRYSGAEPHFFAERTIHSQNSTRFLWRFRVSVDPERKITGVGDSKKRKSAVRLAALSACLQLARLNLFTPEILAENYAATGVILKPDQITELWKDNGNPTDTSPGAERDTGGPSNGPQASPGHSKAHHPQDKHSFSQAGASSSGPAPLSVQEARHLSFSPARKASALLPLKAREQGVSDQPKSASDVNERLNRLQAENTELKGTSQKAESELCSVKRQLDEVRAKTRQLATERRQQDLEQAIREDILSKSLQDAVVVANKKEEELKDLRSRYGNLHTSLAAEIERGKKLQKERDVLLLQIKQNPVDDNPTMIALKRAFSRMEEEVDNLLGRRAI